MNKNLGITGVVLVGIVITIALIEFMPMPHRAFSGSNGDMMVVPVQQPAVATPAPVASDKSVNLAGNKYRLVSYNSIASPGSAQYTVAFDAKNVNAKFCNGMGGGYTLKNGTLFSSQLVGTMMFCESPKGLMDAEGLFGKMLGLGAVATVKDDTLTLAAGKDVMVFTKIK